MRDSPATGPDRRQTPRTKLAEIAYIGMGPENGGLVLDVSDGGLSFHSVAPVQPAEKIQFLLSLRGHSRIEGAGEVVWTNDMKTVCGLKFISLSSGAREHLNNWTNQSKFPPPPRERRTPQKPVLQTIQAPIAVRSAEKIDAPVFAMSPAANAPLTTREGRTIWHEPLFLWMFVAVLGFALAVAAFKYGVQVGRSQVGTLARAIENPPTQASPQIATPAPAPSSSSQTEATHSTQADAPSGSATVSSYPNPSPAFVNASKTEDNSGSAGASLNTEENGAAAAAQKSEQQQQAGQSELSAARAYLTGPAENRDSAKAARLLWAAVGNGNSAAEVILADLYARGDGVPMSCEQARILLVAAIKSGNIEAQQKLKDLNMGACK